MKVAISFLKSKYDIEKTIDLVSKTDADYIHVDVMDGKFVANKTESFIEILKKTKKLLDVHLMVDNPIPYIIEYKNLKPDCITIHSEINYDINDVIDLIHSYNIKAGISIKPKTSIESIKKYLNKIDNILIMSVEPGKGGQKFMESVIPKIKKIRELKNLENYNYIISIDGGINDNTVKMVRDVDLVISGSYVCMGDNYQNSINKLR